MDVQAMLDSFKVMGFGMGGIFISIITIMIVIWLLNKIFAPKNSDKN